MFTAIVKCGVYDNVWHWLATLYTPEKRVAKASCRFIAWVPVRGSLSPPESSMPIVQLVSKTLHDANDALLGKKRSAQRPPHPHTPLTQVVRSKSSSLQSFPSYHIASGPRGPQGTLSKRRTRNVAMHVAWICRHTARIPFFNRTHATQPINHTVGHATRQAVHCNPCARSQLRLLISSILNIASDAGNANPTRHKIILQKQSSCKER